MTFGLSALILRTGVRSRPVPGREGAARASLWSVSADGIRIVFGSHLLLTLLLFGWLAMSWTHLRGRLIQATERAGEP